jgi:hypothetical protein
MLPELDAVGSDAAGSWACQSVFGRPEHSASESGGAGGSTVPTYLADAGAAIVGLSSSASLIASIWLNGIFSLAHAGFGA